MRSMSPGVSVYMKLWRNLAITGFCLTTGATGALAQTVSTPFALNNSVSFDGLTATITSLSCTSTVACATDNELEVTSLDRDDLQFEIVNSNPGSAIFAGTTGSTASETDTLTFTLSIVADPDYSHAIGTPSSVTTSATGWQAYSSCDPCSGVSATGSSVPFRQRGRQRPVDRRLAGSGFGDDRVPGFLFRHQLGSDHHRRQSVHHRQHADVDQQRPERDPVGVQCLRAAAPHRSGARVRDPVPARIGWSRDGSPAPQLGATRPDSR